MAKIPTKPSVDRFIKEYVLTGLCNGKQAAINAGYSEKTADQQASRLLKKVKVIDAIREHQAMIDKSFVWSKEKKLGILEKIVAKAIEDDVEKGMINMQSAIAALKEHNLMQGDNAPITTESTVTTQTLAEKLSGGSKR